MKFADLVTIATSAGALFWQKPLIGDETNIEHSNLDPSLTIDFLSKHFEVFEHDEFVIKQWGELLKEMGPLALADGIKHYKSASFPGTSQIFESKFSAFNTPVLKAPPPKFETVEERLKFKDHSLRIREGHPEDLGLDTVKQFSGYLDIEDEDKHLFYWFFESRNDPKNDPLILWLNGGPGCSSSVGLFFELGPSSISLEIQPVYNPYSWNSNASVIFLDQPAGVGYSYVGASGSAVSSTAAAAKDVYAFLELFFVKFPQFRTNKFHIAGESYGGHYVPRFAAEIVRQEDRTFDLASILVGNGITDDLIQEGAYRPMACGEGGYKQVIPDEECDNMDKIYKERCAPLVKLCYAAPTAFTCVPAQLACSKLMEPYVNTGLNYYDIRRPCEGKLCYKEEEWVDQFLDSEFVKYVAGADPSIGEFQSCSSEIGSRFVFSGDHSKPFQQYVAELLELGIPVLLYAGDKDFICNWLGNHAWSDALEYLGHDQFEAASLKPYYTLNNTKGGEVKNYQHFTFLRVYDAGHMVPYDQPYVALDMVNRWLAGDYAFGSKK